MFFLQTAWAAAPGLINYQGKLANNDGTPRPSVAHNVVVGLYDASSGGSALFTETHPSVTPVNGVFNIQIGSITGGLSDVLQVNPSLWLEIEVNGTPMLPRQRLQSSPYALSVATGSVNTNELRDNAVTTAKIGDDQVTTAKIDDLAVTDAKIADVDWTKIANVPSSVGAPNVSQNGTSVVTSVANINFSNAFTVTDGGSNQANITPAISSVTLMGNTFNSANRLVQLTSAVQPSLPSLSGANLTNLPAGQLAGTINDSLVFISTRALTGVLPVNQGGTGTSSTLNGVLLGGSSISSVASTTSGQVLRYNGTGYEFATLSPADVGAASVAYVDAATAAVAAASVRLQSLPSAPQTGNLNLSGEGVFGGRVQVGGGLSTDSNMEAGGADFIFGTNSGRNQGDNNTPDQRALVHGDNASLGVPDDSLIINYAGDFEGGTRIQGPSLRVEGNLNVGGTITGNGSGLTNVSGTDSSRVSRTGDVMTGNLRLSGPGTWVGSNYGSGPGQENDFWSMFMDGQDSDSGIFHIRSGDNGNEPIVFEQVNDATVNTRLSIDSSGNTNVFGRLAVSGGPVMAGGWVNSLRVAATHPTIQLKGGSQENDSAWIGYDDATATEGLGFWVNGSDDDIGTATRVVTMRPSGNVGIGTTSPGDRLSVAGEISYAGAGLNIEGTYNKFALYADTTNQALFEAPRLTDASNGTKSNYYFSHRGAGSSGALMTILGSTGRVGVGETNPSSLLHINGDTSNALRISRGSGNIDMHIADGGYGYLDLGGGTTFRGSTQSSSFGGPVTLSGVGGGLTIGSSTGWNEITFTDASGDPANIVKDGNGPIVFSTNGSERMRISGDGNIGFGTTPSYRLDVDGDMNIRGAGNYRKDGNVVTISPWVGSGSDIYFTGGNVGIGTSSPSDRLSVDGTFSVGNVIRTTPNGHVGINDQGFDPETFGTLYVRTNNNRNAITGTGIFRGTALSAVEGHSFDDSLADEFNNTGRLGYFDDSGTSMSVWGGGDSDYAGYFDGQTYVGGRLGVGTLYPWANIESVDATPTSDSPAVYGQHAVTDFYGVGVSGYGYYKGIFGSAFGDGTGSTTPSYFGGDFSSYSSNPSNGTTYGIRASASGAQTNWAGYFEGDVHVTGAISATSKPFRINHPQKPDYLLYHNAIEGAEVAVYYRGTARLQAGQTVVTLPGYFESLTRKESRTVLLTSVDGFDPIAVKKTDGQQIKDGRFVVVSNNPSSTQEFNWEVKAIRSDVPLLDVEVPKKESEKVEERRREKRKLERKNKGRDFHLKGGHKKDPDKD